MVEISMRGVVLVTNEERLTGILFAYTVDHMLGFPAYNFHFVVVFQRDSCLIFTLGSIA